MMRLTLSVLLVSLALAGASALVYWRSAAFEEGDLAARAGRVTADFRRAHGPRAGVGASALLAGRTEAELVDPSRTLPRFHEYPREEVDALHQYAQDCRTRRADRGGALSKAWAWHSFVCGGRLAPGFFDRAPWMHPSGRSYVRLAFETGTFSREWLESHRARAHVLELAALGLVAADSELAAMSRSTLRAILAEEPLVLAGSRILIGKSKGRDGAASLEYEAYDRVAWDRFLGKRGLVADESARLDCALREGNACWNTDLTAVGPGVRWLAAVFFAASLGLALGASWLALKRLQAGREERERKTFLLRMLAHEFRTPVTALQLSLEALRKDFDRLPPSAQEGFLHASEQVVKLGRLVEASRGYLSAKEFQLNPVTVPSLREFLEGALGEHEGRFNLACADGPARIDPYWTALCVRNLVENALLHGEPPVLVRVEKGSGGLSIAVEDAGPGPNATAAVDRKPGLGLGLGIVRTAARAMGGDLVFRPDPTTFVLSLGPVTQEGA